MRPKAKNVTMTPQHFEFIAKVLKDFKAEPGLTSLDRAMVYTLAQRFADKLADTNPKFRREQFLGACDVGGDTQ